MCKSFTDISTVGCFLTETGKGKTVASLSVPETKETRLRMWEKGNYMGGNSNTVSLIQDSEIKSHDMSKIDLFSPKVTSREIWGPSARSVYKMGDCSNVAPLIQDSDAEGCDLSELDLFSSKVLAQKHQGLWGTKVTKTSKTEIQRLLKIVWDATHPN